jgi:hypothetical protein
MEVVVPQRVEPKPPSSVGRTSRVSCGSFSATSSTERFPAAARTPRPRTAMMFSGESSKICCVASRRRPSRWNSSIQ